MEALSFFLDVSSRGIAVGATYALMGLGLTLVFGVMRIVNFAQGEFYMLGSYLVFLLMTDMNLPFYIAIPFGIFIVFCIGALVEKTLLSPISKGKIENPMEYSLIITIGLSILIKQLVILYFGPNFQKINDFVKGNVSFGPITMTWSLFISFIFSAILITIVTIFIHKTWRGRSWRAISESLSGAKILGVNVNREKTMVFALSCALGAAAGAILAPITLIYPTSGTTTLIKGYEIIAIGGLGSIPGSLIGGMLLGLTETLGSVYISAAYKDFYGFLLLILFLIFKPRGLFGQAK